MGDPGGDVLLEVAGSALVEVDFEDVVVEGRDGGEWFGHRTRAVVGEGDANQRRPS